MRMPAALAVCGSLLLACQAAGADDALPHRRAGLWETTMNFAQRAGPGMKSQQCIDASTDEAMQRRATESDPSMKCERTGVTKIAGGVEATSICKTTHGTLTSRMRITGDMQNSYHAEISAHRDPPIGAIADTQSVIEAKWLGACPADMKPGDMRMNGMTLHMGAAAAAAAAGKQGMTGPGGMALPGIDLEALKAMTPEQRREYLKTHMPGNMAP